MTRITEITKTKIRKLRAEGLTWEVIGARVSMSPSGARRIYKKRANPCPYPSGYKSMAARMGISVAEYAEGKKLGKLYCSRCETWYVPKVVCPRMCGPCAKSQRAAPDAAAHKKEIESRRVERRLARRSEIDDELYIIMAQCGPSSVSELARQMQCATPLVRKQLLRLQRNGLAVRGEDTKWEATT